ncbi:aquaporin SIP [Marchantia polymorpha subsp. ruderalis]|uniref:Aquaporin n=2 Tax=Marchantia polymorpha TaxID=3197 RepID=A0AAF6BRN5_MARPO|nr:hypothetical protein MARPO_0059s0002 [Marchantia polymorpha]BBN14669.1 hypothetical protein Mp_6g13470 [Marchantia polymorpha subsp. ruderalis]|eukprot:PTQ37049.1 hypothetical protein MARPO_0059s0002 [Marchantia polymorpha]
MGKSGVMKMAVLDGIMSFFWTLITSSIGAAAFVIERYTQYEGDRTPIVYALVLVVNLVFVEFSFKLGGPAWNPTAPVAFYAAGASDDTLLTLLVRMPAMAAGAAAGVLTATSLMPAPYRPLMGSGPNLKTDLWTGALAEGGLTFAINLIVLYVVLRGTSNRFLQTPLIVACALVLVQQGAKYTGPAMNPSDAFGWAYLNKTSSVSEQLVVYWLSPLLGTVAAAMVFRGVFGSPRDNAAAAAKAKEA